MHTATVLSLAAAWFFTLLSFCWEECNCETYQSVFFLIWSLCPKLSLSIPRVMKIHLGPVIHVEYIVHCVKASTVQRLSLWSCWCFCWKASDHMYGSASGLSILSTDLFVLTLITHLITVILKQVMKLSNVKSSNPVLPHTHLKIISAVLSLLQIFTRKPHGIFISLKFDF